MITPTISLSSAAVPVTVDDVLNLQLSFPTATTATGTVRIFQIDEKGNFIQSAQEWTFNLAAQQQTVQIRLAKGILGNVSVFINDAGISPGTVFAKLFIQRGNPAVVTNQLFLTAGYISDDVALNYPGTAPSAQQATWTPSTIQTISNPAAGAEFSANINNLGPYLIDGCAFTLVTSAAVANRRPQFIFTQGGVVRWQYHMALNHTASATVTYFASPGFAGVVDDYGNQNGYFPIPKDMSGTSLLISSLTSALQAADQWTGLTVFLRKQANY